VYFSQRTLATMATPGMWNTLSLALKIISKQSVNPYYTLPNEKILACTTLTKFQILWLHFSVLYYITNAVACCLTLYSLRKINQSNINVNVSELMITLVILMILGISCAPCWSFTFHPSGMASLVSDLRGLQKITKGTG